MTIKESSICGLVQSFPILLILAQKYEKCLKTPLVYEPPSPSPSPEYYAALDALFQNLFGHGYHGDGHNLHGCAYAYGTYEPSRHGHAHSPCYTYSYPTAHEYHGHGVPIEVGYGYPSSFHGASSPSYGLKKVSVYNLSGTHGYKGTYAPTQVYNLNHKYKVVVKKNKHRRPHKLQNFYAPTHWKHEKGGFAEASKRIHNNQYLSIFESNNDRLRKVPPVWAIEENDTKNNYEDKIAPKEAFDYVPPILSLVKICNETTTTQKTMSAVTEISKKEENIMTTTTPAENSGSNPMERCEVQGRPGACVPLQNCDSFIRLMWADQKNTDPALSQFLRLAYCGVDGSNPKVCCLFTNSQLPKSSLNSSVVKSNEQAPLVDKSDLVQSLPEPPVCGISNASIGMVVGGVDATLGDFPWMAMLGYKKRGSTSWKCAGSLVSSKHVLTAAHCIHNQEKSLYVVRLGELDISRDDEGSSPVDVLIKRAIKHELYDSDTIANDVGLLVLQRDITFTDLIRPICLPRSEEMRSTTYEGYNPIVAGWGDLELRGRAATLLQAAQLPVVSNNVCKKAYMDFQKQIIDERVLCASYVEGGKNACAGDRGSPLMQPMLDTPSKKTYFYQIGVVSFGKKCTEAGFLGVHTRVTHFIPWIEEQILDAATPA